MPERRRHGLRRAFRFPGLTRSQARAEVDEELAFHLDEMTDELVAQGWSKPDARFEAQRRFGDLDFTTRFCTREMRRVATRERRTMWMDDLTQDLRVGVRGLWKSPTYTLVVVATLALGIAASTTIFSVMNPYLYRSLPFADPDRLVQIGGVDLQAGYDGGRFSHLQIEDLAERSDSLSSVGSYYYGSVNHTGMGDPEVLLASYVSANLLDVLGVEPILGRRLRQDDALTGGPRVAVIGEALWRDRWGGDSSVIGQTMRLDGEAHEIVGVLPKEFVFPFGDLFLWLPARIDPLETQRGDMWRLPVARLAPGVDAAQAKRELDTVVASLGQSHPDEDGRYSGVSVKPLREALNFVWEVMNVGFYLLLGAVVFVLLIACINVASLTLARARSRVREVAIRSAIGAHRGRIARQLFTESVLLALLGGALGVLLAAGAARMIDGVLPTDLFRVGRISLDPRVLFFAVGLSLVTPIFFGLVPAWSAAKTSLVRGLRDGAGSGSDPRSLRGRQMLVVTEVTLAIVLVTATGLMIRSLLEVVAVDVGFDVRKLQTVIIEPDPKSYPEAENIAQFFDQVKAELQAVPGVRSVGVASHLPLNHETFPLQVQRAEASNEPMDTWPSAFTSWVGPDYFEAMGITLLAGEGFDDGTGGGGVVISRTMAQQLFDGEPAVGSVIAYGSRQARTATVIGVVEEVRYSDLVSDDRPHLYRALADSTRRRRHVVVQATTDLAALPPLVENAVATVDPELPLTQRPYTEIMRESTLLWSMSSAFLGVFGVIAILLAALGIYGLMSFTVAQRRREMGLRMALGADQRSITKTIVVGGLKLTGIGIGVGVVVAVTVATAARSVLYGVSAVDPVTLLAVVLGFAVVALFAAAIPARRAARVDPLQVLRSE